MRMVALHTAATALIYYAHRASILQHGWITTAFHSATRMDPFTSPLGHPFCNTDGLCSTPQQGWTRSSHRRNGTHLQRPSGLHSATRIDCRNKDGHALHIAATAPIYYAPRASILQHGWIKRRSAPPRTDPFFTSPQPHSSTTPLGHPSCNTDGLGPVPQQGWTRFLTSPQRRSFTTPFGHPFCNTDGWRSNPQQGWIRFLTSLPRHSISTPFGHSFQHGWIVSLLRNKHAHASSHRCNGIHLLCPSGIHSATQMDCVPSATRRLRFTSPQRYSFIMPVMSATQMDYTSYFLNSALLCSKDGRASHCPNGTYPFMSVGQPSCNRQIYTPHLLNSPPILQR